MKLQGIILSALILQGCNTQPIHECGTFDLKQLDADLKSDYFDRAGIEMIKAATVSLKLQLECERRQKINSTGDT